MTEAEELSGVLGEIYDAAIAPERWPEALAAICRYVGGISANIFWHDATSSAAGSHYAYGLDPKYRQSYVDTYAPLNPLFPATGFVEPGVVVSCFDIVPEEEFRATRIFQEWVQPQGIGDSLAVNLEREATVSSLVSIMLPEKSGPADAATRRRFELLVPHIMRSAAIGRIIARETSRRESFEALLMRMSDAVLLLDREARIVFANGAADALVREKKILTIRGGRLAVQLAPAQQLLTRAIDDAANQFDGTGVRASAVPLMQEAGTRWLAHVLPLTSGNRLFIAGASKAVAAVFVRRAQIAVPSALEVLARLHRLTGSEVRVLHGVAELGGLPAVAVALGISEATAKSHLKSLFHKTGTNRQADLVKLLAGAASPVTDPD